MSTPPRKRRTNTINKFTFTRPGDVVYEFPKYTSASCKVRITLPPGSTWTSGPHWHEKRVEYFRVVQGAAWFTLNGEYKVYRPSDGNVPIPLFTVHEWGRAPEQEEGDLIVDEWTAPADSFKIAFFRNLNSVILDETGDGKTPPRSEWWLTLQLWVICHGLDNWPVFCRGLFGVQWVVTHVFLGLVALVGSAVWGLRAAYDEYTAQGIKDVIRAAKEGKRVKKRSVD